MSNLGWMQNPAASPSQARLANDLSDFYRRTKVAQAQAEESGFAGIAAALADMAATLELEPDLDPLVVWELAGCDPIDPAERAGTRVRMQGGRPTRH